VPVPGAGTLVPKAERRFGYDGRNRLIAAEGRVAGFEVPVGLQPIKRYPNLLVFELTAPSEDIVDFYTGMDRRTGRRFSSRRYAVTELEQGYDIHHTASSSKRLKLDIRQLQANIFIVAGPGRTHTFKFHTAPRQEPAQAAKRFLNPINRKGPRKFYFDSRSEDGGTATGSESASGSASGSASESESGSESGAPATRASSARPSGSNGLTGNTVADIPDSARRVAPDQIQGQNRYWQHPASAERDVSQKVRDWLEQNPGETFYD
jgi:hypothetical protein